MSVQGQDAIAAGVLDEALGAVQAAVGLVVVRVLVQFLVGYGSDNPVWPVWAWAVQAVVVSWAVVVPVPLVASAAVVLVASVAVPAEMVAVLA